MKRALAAAGAILAGTGLGLAPGCGHANSAASTPEVDAGALLYPENCAACHMDHYNQWRGSMHAYASQDPAFLAMNRRMQRENPGLGTFCVKCHAPMAVVAGKTTNGLNLSELDARYLGVTCYFCHSIEAVDTAHPFNAAVTLASDLSRDKLVDALRSFAAASEKADWAVIYYAGHGIELGGVNYLVPVDARLIADRDVQFEAVPLDQALGAVEGAHKLRMVLLDACRENPFARQMQRTLAARSVGRGLARIEPGPGTLVAYAARDGQVALDGEGQNSPFAAALVKLLKRPGLEVNKLFRLVHDDVMDATGNRQEPYTYGALPGREDFFFVAR